MLGGGPSSTITLTLWLPSLRTLNSTAPAESCMRPNLSTGTTCWAATSTHIGSTGLGVLTVIAAPEKLSQPASVQDKPMTRLVHARLLNRTMCMIYGNVAGTITSSSAEVSPTWLHGTH